MRPASSCITASRWPRSDSGEAERGDQPAEEVAFDGAPAAGRELARLAPTTWSRRRAREHRPEDDVLGHAEEGADVVAAQHGEEELVALVVAEVVLPPQLVHDGVPAARHQLPRAQRASMHQSPAGCDDAAAGARTTGAAAGAAAGTPSAAASTASAAGAALDSAAMSFVVEVDRLHEAREQAAPRGDAPMRREAARTSAGEGGDDREDVRVEEDARGHRDAQAHDEGAHQVDHERVDAAGRRRRTRAPTARIGDGSARP